MQRSRHLFALAALCASVAGCYAPEPRPFASRGGRSLDQAPRYSETNRFMEPTEPRPRVDEDPGIDIAPPERGPAPAPGADSVDPGLTASPAPSGAAASTTTTTTTETTATSPAAPKPATGDAPYARAVPGKPGFVYSPHEQGKILDVTGMRPGTKVKDPQTGAMFRVP